MAAARVGRLVKGIVRNRPQVVEEGIRAGTGRSFGDTPLRQDIADLRQILGPGPGRTTGVGGAHWADTVEEGIRGGAGRGFGDTSVPQDIADLRQVLGPGRATGITGPAGRRPARGGNPFDFKGYDKYGRTPVKDALIDANEPYRGAPGAGANWSPGRTEPQMPYGDTGVTRAGDTPVPPGRTNALVAGDPVAARQNLGIGSVPAGGAKFLGGDFDRKLKGLRKQVGQVDNMTGDALENFRGDFRRQFRMDNMQEMGLDTGALDQRITRARTADDFRNIINEAGRGGAGVRDAYMQTYRTGRHRISDPIWANKVPQKGAAIGGTAWLVSSLSNRRGQQSNAELYGQTGMGAGMGPGF